MCSPSRTDDWDKLQSKSLEVRLGLIPFVPKRQKEDEKSRDGGMATTGSHFIPDRLQLHDVAFTSLRLMVFKIEKKSATPIAHLLRQDLSPAEVFSLLQKEQAKTRSVPYERLRIKVEEARKKHAIRLRDAMMEDVDICYSKGEGNLSSFKSDKSQIEKYSGKPYHLWPYDAEKSTIRMSIIVKSTVLAELYPPERLGKGIEIKVNTPQAPVERISHPGLPVLDTHQFQYIKPNGSAAEPSQVFEKASERKTRKAVIDSMVRQVIGKGERSNSAKDIVDAPKHLSPNQPWHAYVTINSAGQTRPFWQPRKGPVQKDNKEDSSWWLDDLATRQERIHGWDEVMLMKKEMKKGEEVVEDSKRSRPDKPPAEAAAGVDFTLVPGLSSTYTEDRNYDWHQQNVASEEAKEKALERNNAERQYAMLCRTAEQVDVSLQKTKDQAGQRKPDLRSQIAIKNLKAQQLIADHQLEASRQQVLELRKDCGYKGESLTSGLVDAFGEKSSRERMKQEQKQWYPNTCSELSQTSHEQNDAANLSARHTPDVEIPNRDPTNSTTTTSTKASSEERDSPTPSPFPPYEDPMLQKADNEELHERVTSDLISNKQEEAMESGKDRKESITKLLIDSGFQREQLLSRNLTLAGTAYGSPPPTPVTPSAWLGTSTGLWKNPGEVVDQPRVVSSDLPALVKEYCHAGPNEGAEI